MASSSKKKLNDFITAWWTVGEQASSSYTAFNQQKKKVALLYNTRTESELEKPNTATAIEESVLILRLALKRKCWIFFIFYF